MQRKGDFARIRLVLAHSAHFRKLTAVALDRLAGMARIRHLRHGERVSGPGVHSDYLWIVLDGGIRLSTRLKAGRGEQVHAVLGRGSYFGLATTAGHEQFAIEAHALGPTDIAVVDGARLRATLKLYPQLWRYISSLLFARLKLALSLMQDSRVKSLQERIARRLLGHAMSSELRAGEQPELRMTQADLARMLGAGRPRINRALKVLEADGLIRSGYRTIRVIDLARLRKLAGADVQAF